MNSKFAKIAAALLITIAGGTVQAGAAPFQRTNPVQGIAPVQVLSLLLPAVQQAQPFGGAAIGFVGNDGPVADTCTQSTPGNPEACDIDQLTQRCDDAGGGMSSLPGGGVDCDTSHWD